MEPKDKLGAIIDECGDYGEMANRVIRETLKVAAEVAELRDSGEGASYAILALAEELK